MKATRKLHDLGQSLWLDNITRDLLDSGTLRRYIEELSVTGLTSNPTIFDKAIGGNSWYDADIRGRADQGLSTEALFFELAIQDLRQAADLFAPIHKQTAGVDGFVSLEVSPLLAFDTDRTVAQAKQLFAKADRKNLFIKIPGTQEGLPAIEEAIYAGIPVNVTLLFSCEQYLAAAEAYMRGLERRVKAGLNPDIASVASLFVSRWDRAVAKSLPKELQNQLGIAISGQAFSAYRDLMDSDRWQKLAGVGARPQRLLFASTGSKDPAASPVMYISALAAPNTVNTMPEETLLAFGENGEIPGILPRSSATAEQALTKLRQAGVDTAAIAAQLQTDGAKSFADSWHELMKAIETKSKAPDRKAPTEKTASDKTASEKSQVPA
jgi:transaldolase